MMKNVSNSTKAPDLGEASFDLSTAKGLLEALRDQFDYGRFCSFISKQSYRKCCNLGVQYESIILYMDGATESNSRIR